ncbi:MAG: coenzyme F420-0:L-glutamate ligase [Woeseia sp.]|nr:coenzyme F420-0:L-glutamate ligase [Woeseia sp.]|tara:strand:- start:259 stop:1023 length:765 start_codon:yes stop_codon:yes gene_type:complete
MQSSLSIHALVGIPIVNTGDDIASLISTAVSDPGMSLVDGDIVVVSQKIVSLAENRLVHLDSVKVSAKALKLANETDKDPRLVELILQESTAVIRAKPGVIIVRNRLGFVGANAGIDQSNIDHSGGESALLLPVDPDGTARKIRSFLMQDLGCNIGVIISDSTNRPWRLGSIGAAIGSAGITVIDDRRGDDDLYGRKMKITEINRADAIAAAAVLIMGETAEKTPVAIVHGFSAEDSGDGAKLSIRSIEEDLFL